MAGIITNSSHSLDAPMSQWWKAQEEHLNEDNWTAFHLETMMKPVFSLFIPMYLLIRHRKSSSDPQETLLTVSIYQYL